MEVIIKYINNGIYTRQIHTFKKKNLKYYLYILYLKLTRTYYEVVESDKIIKRKK